MKKAVVAFALAVAAALALVGCSDSPEPDDGSEAVPDKVLEVSSFSFRYSGMTADDYGNYALFREGDAVRLTADFIVRDPVDVIVDDSALEEISVIATSHRLHAWNGFDKTDGRALDGRSFSLSATLADGSTIEARGSNSFPDGFREAEAAILAFFEELIAQQVGEAPVAE